jgi:hypothetical protein
VLDPTPAALRTAGLVATLAALAATAGDGLLLWVANAARPDLAGLPPPPGGALLGGLYLGALAIPLYAAGYWQVGAALAPAGAGRARAVFLLGAYGAALGGAIHAVTGLVLHVERAGGVAAAEPLEVVARWGAFLLPPWGLAAVLLTVAWALCARAVLGGRTLYPRWTAAANPLLLLGVLAALSAGSTWLRAFLLPAAPNVVHVLFFGLSTAVLRSRPRPHRPLPEPADDTGEPFPEPLRIPIEDALDLHPFAPRDVPSVVEEYLAAARDAGFTEVRVIHGRGRGVQRARVRALLAGHPLVVEARDAPPERGGAGATVVRLAPRGTAGQR